MTATVTSPVLVIIGPSGSGKSALVRHLALRRRLRVHPTWTTRPRRADEWPASIEHRFVDDGTFDWLDGVGFFLDTVQLFGLPYRYGLRPIVPSTDHRVDTVMLRAPLVERFRQVVQRPTVVVAIEDDPVRLAERLRARGTTEDEVAKRVADNENELRLGRTVADVVLANDATLDDLAERVLAHLHGAVAA